MSFVLNQSKTFKWPVEFTTVAESGDVTDNKFTAVFKRLPRDEVIKMTRPDNADGKAVTLDELQGLRQKINDLSDDEAFDAFVKELDTLIERQAAVKTAEQIIERDVDGTLRFLDGWENVEINGSTAFDREKLTALLKAIPDMHITLFATFFEATMGGQKRKNSSKRRNTGR